MEAAALGGIIGSLGMIVFGLYNIHKAQSQVDTVQSGYVDPSKLEQVVEDLDRDGKNEVYLRYDGKDYPIKVDEQGRPNLQY